MVRNHVALCPKLGISLHMQPITVSVKPQGILHGQYN
jgi:hypothetical protein